MTAYAWGTGRAFDVASCDLWLEGQSVATRSLISHALQTSGSPFSFWKATLTFGSDYSADRELLLAFLRKLNGMQHRIALHDLRKYSAAGVQGSPAGSINTTGVQVKTTAAQFATSVVLKGCGNTKTLAPLDMLSIGGQLIENTALATSDAGGDMTVQVPEGLRATAAANAAVTLVKPTANFVVVSPVHGPRSRAMYEPFALELEEAP